MPPRRPARPSRTPRTTPSPAPAAAPDVANLAAALRLVADAVRADAGLDDLYSYGATVGITDEDVYSDPTDYHDTLDEDEEITSTLSSEEWKTYVENFRHFIEMVIEGWRNEGRRFRSQSAKLKAIARLVMGTREQARKDPRKWIAEHCDWSPV